MVNTLLVQNQSRSETGVEEGQLLPPLFYVNAPLLSCPFFLEYKMLQILPLEGEGAQKHILPVSLPGSH